MKNIRNVIGLGNSVAVTIPPEMGLEKGDAVKIRRDGDDVIISKLKLAD